ncbi:hypothetical protein OAO87_00175 [bacterium]|nr:hypothetical protein [bacterium]
MTTGSRQGSNVDACAARRAVGSMMDDALSVLRFGGRGCDARGAEQACGAAARCLRRIEYGSAMTKRPKDAHAWLGRREAERDCRATGDGGAGRVRYRSCHLDSGVPFSHRLLSTPPCGCAPSHMTHVASTATGTRLWSGKRR